MSFRTTYILFGILGLMVLVFGLALWLAPSAPPDTRYLFPSTHVGDSQVGVGSIHRVELSRVEDEANFVFSRDSSDKPFVMEKPSGYRVNDSAVSQLVSQILDAQPVKGDNKGKLSAYGLEKPRGKVVLTSDKGTQYVVELGDNRGDRVYVLSSERKKTPLILVKSDVDRIYNTLNQFRATDLVDWKNDDIKVVKLERPSKKESVALIKEDTRWRYGPVVVEGKTLQPYGAADYDGSTEGNVKGLNGVSSILNAIASLRAEGKTETADKDKDKDTEKKKPEHGFVKDNASDDDLKKFGLDSEANSSLVIDLKKNADDKEGKVILFGKDVEKTDLVYARLASEKNVVTVTKKMLEPFQQLLDKPESLRDRNLVKLSDKPDVISVKYRDGQTIWLYRTAAKAPPRDEFHGGIAPNFADTWKLYRGDDKKGETTDPDAIKKLIDLINARQSIKDFPANREDPAMGLKDPQNLTVSLWAGGIKQTEKKEDDKDKKPEADGRPELKSATPDVQLVFGQVDSKNLAAVLRKAGKDLKQEDVVKVDDAILKAAREDWLVYLDKSIPPLFNSEASLNKITLDLDGKQTVIERKKADDPKSEWVFKKPSEWDGRKVDDMLLREKILGPLITLRAKKWEALKPSPEELARWGLKSPTAKITLETTVDKKPKETTLFLGSVADDKSNFYAKKSDDDRVFTIDKTPIDDMKAPILDLRVVDMQAGNVKTVKLKWADALGERTLELERKAGAGAGWEAKGAAASVKLNNSQVDALVNTLSGMRAKKFVAYKTGPTEAQGLNLKKGALEVELISVDKEPKKIVLTLGGADMDGLFATSDQLKGDVFVVEKGQDNILEKAKEPLKHLVSN